MAKERKSWFFHQREQYGSCWIDRQKPDDLIRNSERILTDIAYGNIGDMNSDNFKDLCHLGLVNALSCFCEKRMNIFTSLNKCVEVYRNYLTNNNSSDTNVELYAISSNVYNCMCCYTYAYNFLTSYINTGDITYMINFCNLMQDYKNWIVPSRFM